MGKLGLVLAGGGAKGSYQVGAYKALLELGLRPDIITGASVGSLNGAMFTMGKLDEAVELWTSMDVHNVLETPKSTDRQELRDFFKDVVDSGGLDVEPLGDTIDKYLDEELLRHSPIRFGLVMTVKDTLESVRVRMEDIPEGQLKDYLLASSACFPALRPRRIDGVDYIDGGWRDNMPLDFAAELGAEELIGIDIDGIGITRPNNTGLPTRIISSHWNLGPMLDFDKDRAARNIALGYFDTMRSFGRMGGTAYGILPDSDDFLRKFAAAYQEALSQVTAVAPELKLAESLARQLAKFPPEFEPDPTAPTRGALAPLELAAERMGVDPSIAYTPRTLALTFLGSFDKDPADRYPALFGQEEDRGRQLGERAMAAAASEDFVTALVSKALSQVSLF